ncbi:hypothetical protein MN032_11110 [Agromyces atrinae]|uniref:hypothetical protein n=1 Tax=Agromyces atrinae TaxID=592376 RepID=UPI001F58E008|nr:hypothetical protein [Agromyces atrinae]MCI2958247.1 hypothetical protein [Agromyces atrinae]
MARKILTGNVSYLDDDLKLHTLFTGDTVSGEALKYITNTALLTDADGDSGAGETPTDQAFAAEVQAYVDANKGDELRKLAKERKLDGAGTKEAIATRLVISDRAAAKAAADSGTDGDSGEEPTGRAALEAKATELKVPFDEETTDAELEQLIENASE